MSRNALAKITNIARPTATASVVISNVKKGRVIVAILCTFSCYIRNNLVLLKDSLQKYDCFCERFKKRKKRHFYFAFLTFIISAAILTAISSGVSLLILTPIGEYTFLSRVLELPLSSRLSNICFFFAVLAIIPK